MIVRGRAGRRANAVRGARLVARQEFGDGRHVRQRRQAFAVVTAKCPQLAGLDLSRSTTRSGRMSACTRPASRSVSTGTAAAIRHVDDIDAGHELEQLAGDMLDACRRRPSRN